MRWIVMGFALGCLSAIPAYCSTTCGIGTAVKKFKFVEHPLFSDFELPGRVILQESEGNPPFHFCDEQSDLRPGIAFMNKYVDRLISTGASEAEPEIVTMRETVAAMKKLSEQYQLEKKTKKKHPLPQSAQVTPPPPANK